MHSIQKKKFIDLHAIIFPRHVICSNACAALAAQRDLLSNDGRRALWLQHTEVDVGDGVYACS